MDQTTAPTALVRSPAAAVDAESLLWLAAPGAIAAAEAKLLRALYVMLNDKIVRLRGGPELGKENVKTEPECTVVRRFHRVENGFNSSAH
jgi:hypothetical protein